MPSPFPDRVIDQLVSQAPFLWHLRDQAVAASDYTLEEIAELDRRLDAHIGALQMVAPEDLEKQVPPIAKDTPGEMFVHTLLAIRSGIFETMSLADVPDSCRRGLLSALGWLEPEELGAITDGVLALAGLRMHRIDPGSRLKDALQSRERNLIAEGLRIAGLLRRYDLTGLVLQGLEHPEQDVRFQAGRAACLLEAATQAVPALREVALSGGPLSERASWWAAAFTGVGAEVQAWLEETGSRQDLTGCWLQAVQASGLTTAVPELLERMHDPRWAVRAARVFGCITGANLEADDLELTEWAGEDTDLTGMPDQEKITAWWRKNQHRFPPGRFFLGEPFGEAALESAMHAGPQVSRIDAAVHLAALRRDRFVMNARAPGYRQERWLKT